jgi:hypothetical protein
MDLGERRIAEMHAQGIDVPGLSMVRPGLEHSPPDRADAVGEAAVRPGEGGSLDTPELFTEAAPLVAIGSDDVRSLGHI